MSLNTQRYLYGLAVLEEFPPHEAWYGIFWLQPHRMQKACERHPRNRRHVQHVIFRHLMYQRIFFRKSDPLLSCQKPS